MKETVNPYLFLIVVHCKKWCAPVTLAVACL